MSANCDSIGVLIISKNIRSHRGRPVVLINWLSTYLNDLKEDFNSIFVKVTSKMGAEVRLPFARYVPQGSTTSFCIFSIL